MDRGRRSTVFEATRQSAEQSVRMPGKRRSKLAPPAAKKQEVVGRKRKATKAAKPPDEDDVDGEIYDEGVGKEGEENDSDNEDSEEENLEMAEAEGQPTELQASLTTQATTQAGAERSRSMKSSWTAVATPAGGIRLYRSG